MTRNAKNGRAITGRHDLHAAAAQSKSVISPVSMVIVSGVYYREEPVKSQPGCKMARGTL
jgi:hypothetical protein